jgi:hypothetical protein
MAGRIITPNSAHITFLTTYWSDAEDKLHCMRVTGLTINPRVRMFANRFGAWVVRLNDRTIRCRFSSNIPIQRNRKTLHKDLIKDENKLKKKEDEGCDMSE